jgi:hypothetical protein
MRQFVLVIEGSVHTGKLYKAFIERSGYKVMVMGDPEKALKLACAWQPDLVVIDMHLAGNDLQGWSRGCGALLKNHPHNSDFLRGNRKGVVYGPPCGCHHSQTFRLPADSHRC